MAKTEAGSARAGASTGFQVAHANLARDLAGYREQLTEREYAALIDIAGRIVEKERQRLGSRRGLRLVA